MTRRPIQARNSRWAASIAGMLARAGVRPNTISIASVAFAGAAGLCLAVSPLVTPAGGTLLLILAAAGVQARLLCNLFDGMVAVEGGFKTKSGEIFNELPDRFADAFVFVGGGYAVRSIPFGVELGWSAAVLAVITAYVRTLGAATGAGQNFMGPMAKPHRMATVTLACLVAAAATWWRSSSPWLGASAVIWGALALIIAGEIVTIARRVAWIVRTLESK